MFTMLTMLIMTFLHLVAPKGAVFGWFLVEPFYVVVVYLAHRDGNQSGAEKDNRLLLREQIQDGALKNWTNQ